MPSALPVGLPVPASGELPATALAHLGTAPFGIYLHVPFCRTRCGYCDFNTYTDLDGLQASYADVAIREVELARSVLGDRAPVVDTARGFIPADDEDKLLNPRVGTAPPSIAHLIELATSHCDPIQEANILIRLSDRLRSGNGSFMQRPVWVGLVSLLNALIGQHKYGYWDRIEHREGLR